MILVTGGTGLVGMHLLASLRADGKAVRACKRASSDLTKIKEFFDYSFPNKPEAFDEIEWLDTDLLDVESLTFAMSGCQEVYHSAAMVSFHPKDHKDMVDFNVGATANVVNVAMDLGVKSLGYVSSVAAFGRDGKKPVSEKTVWKYDDENSTYAGSKYNSELEVWRGVEEGLNAYMVNPGIIIGIGDFERSSAELFKQVHKGIPFYPGGSNGFVGVQDVVEVLRNITENGAPSRRYLLVAENWSYQTLFDKIAQAVGGKAPEKAAPQILLTLYCWLQKAKEFLTGKRAFVTKESIRNASQMYSYDASKVKSELNHSFHDVGEVINETGSYFKSLISTRR
ncbi:MAG: NAD-dependent epimerase/dehydratase family protein [Flavobacteriales bacterium]